jgi:basic membrane protein A
VLAASTGLSVAGLLVAACSLIYDPDLKEFAEFGDRCVEGSDCASGICRSDRCTRECAGSDPCGDTSECRSGFCSFTSPPPLDGPAKIAFIYNDEVEEHGMIKTHDEAREYVGRNVDGSEATAFPSVSASKVSSTIDSLVADGFNVVIGTNSDYLNAIQNGALRHTDVNFLIYSVYPDLEPAPNMGSYFGRMYQVMFMMGLLAGGQTKTNRVGVIAPVAIPETVCNINAFAQGVFAKNAEAQVVVRWINAWSHDTLEATAAGELVEDANTDVVLGYTETTNAIEAAAALTTAEGDPVYVIGYGSPNACEAADSRCISAAYWNFGPMLTEMVEAMVAGTWVPSVVWEQIVGDPQRSPVYFSSITVVPSGLRMEVEAYVAELARNDDAARMLPFEGPVRDTAGATRISSGHYPSDDDLLSMCWFVEGIYQIQDGEPPTLVPGVVPASCR